MLKNSRSTVAKHEALFALMQEDEIRERVDQRMDAIKKQITQSWSAIPRGISVGQNCCYQLTIEPEVFWRRGASPKRAAVQATSR